MKKIINLLINLIFFVAAAYLLIGFEPKFVFRIEHLAVGLVGGYIVYYLTDFNLLVPIISHAFYNFLVWLSVAEPFLSILTSNLRGRLVALQFFLSNLFSKYSPYVNSILKLFKGFRNGKGISMITFVITTALSVAGIALTLTFLLPEIDRAKASGVINDALQQLDIVDNIVREVATEGTGSQRTYNLRVREGTYQVKNETGSFEFEYTTKQSPLDAGVTAKRGNVVLSTTVAGAKAYESDEDSDGLPELVIENEALKATFRKYPFTYTTWGIRDVG